MSTTELSALEANIRYSFQQKDLLKLALIHSSYANEHKLGRLCYNERLEFLGDAALELVISKFIYNRFPQMPEGELTKLRASVVCEGSLAAKAREVALGDFLRLGKGEDATGGRKRESVLADAFEAVIGAVLLDGGMEAVETYILQLMTDVVEEKKLHFRDMDYKTKLQEIIQKHSKVPLVYKIVGEEGPDHGKEFFATVTHEERLLGRGKGHSKKEAEQNAAKAALEDMAL